ncbi:hypothetical protein OS493_006156 [Desmophyllum pertusum]|uniref:Uncharacterized protein n=1 Tax=Desmophyllum pertusum TaxID=174260 RepID=A0A9X0A4Y1_9CNID|nr:hypothetical protein OS493_006156 [Desmophyllum pertusum]
MDDPNKAKPYFGDCQVASRPDAHSRSLLPLLSLTGGGYDSRNAEGGYAYNEQFNANNGLVPGASSSYLGGNNFVVNGDFPSSNAFSTSNCDSFRTDTSRSTGMPYIPLDGQIESGVHTSVPRNQHPHSGMTGSHLANGSLMGGAEPQLTPLYIRCTRI